MRYGVSATSLWQRAYGNECMATNYDDGLRQPLHVSCWHVARCFPERPFSCFNNGALSPTLAGCVHISAHVSIHTSIHISIHMSIYMPVYMSLHISIHMAAHMCIHMSTHTGSSGAGSAANHLGRLSLSGRGLVGAPSDFVSDVYIGMCIGMCIDMCIRHVYRHACVQTCV